MRTVQILIPTALYRPPIIIIKGTSLLPAMDWILGVAMLVAFAPVFLAMDLVLKNYTYPRVENPFFKDSTFFGLFAVGIVEGAVMAFVIIYFQFMESPIGIIYMILMALLELMAMVVVLNPRRFRGNSDSIFYGYGIGLGMAAGMALGFTYVIANQINSETVDYVGIFLYIVLLSTSMTFIYGASGTNIGEGIARHLPMQFVLQAAIPLAAYNMLFAVMWTSTGFMFYLLLIAMTILGFFYFYKCLLINLPAIVREVLKMNGVKRDDIPGSK